MLFEFRRYQAYPGRRDELVAIMETDIIPFQMSKGVVVVGSFVDEHDPDIYYWIRRFDDEDHRVALYAAVYDDPHWVDDIGPRVRELLDRSLIQVSRLLPTPISVIR